ncbi:tetratricopeptide repeat protein [Qipengyuania sp. DY56-A-20]|uniref:Tetratricopeptide repeat protein n=1 Tax=Qipengyuania benthica TaxID=3067651 RepID=A0ABT9HC74_9SPHN|nr:tetratricopeptide repeat protein [Qipengyuania sp. DY56-A-20]MDP4540931.1 tetratricopeptide repeat protein [Qipengyuania sp. DY56-A-20]
MMREVDDAVRQGDLANFGERYGKPLAALVVLLIVALAAYLLWWQPSQRAAAEARSETLVSALDNVEAGNLQTAFDALEGLAGDGSDAVAANARMLRGGIAAEQGRTEEAVAIFDELASDADAPEELRNLALIRKIATGFDTMDKAAVVAALQPLAVPGEPFFGSAGELLAMAYLEQGQREQAGALFAEIAKTEGVPESLRSRTRQMAGLLGVDAIEDVDALLEAQGVGQAPAADGQGAPTAPPVAQPAS